MENPLEQPAPQDPLQRVHAFARDFAYGVSQDMWGTAVNILPVSGGEEWSMQMDKVGFMRTIREKWEDKIPRMDTLVSFGYATLRKELQYGQAIYIFTEKAFGLLEKPMGIVSAFVSYRRSDSSPLALLIEARLKLVDREIDVFVDKDIPVGAGWEKTLQQKVANARYFICLLGITTLQSKHVCDEILWAMKGNATIISLLHPGVAFESLAALSGLDSRAPGIIGHLQTLQSISIKFENAEEYDTSIRKLLNSMGYSTL